MNLSMLSPAAPVVIAGADHDKPAEWMLQLLMAIEASYVLGTRGSGWNRMIDELRCIWVDCRTPYIEVGPFEDWVRMVPHACREPNAD